MSPVSNTSARRGAGEESNLRNVPHHGLSLPVQNGAFWPKNSLTAMSPLRHRSLWGRKVRDGKARPAPRLRSERGRLRSKSRTFLHEVGNPTSLQAEVGLGPGAGLVGAWCGPGAALAILCWAQDCCLNPAAATGLLTHRIALMQHQQLWLGAVLARAQPCDGVGPAVELPGLRHVIDAHRPLAKSAPRSSD